MTRRAEQKQQTHDRILGAAAKRMADKGLGATSVDGVMSDAGLTHGGFYAHFSNKQKMVEEAFAAAQNTLVEQLCRGLDSSGREAVSQMLARYLGKPHRDRPSEGCLIPVLMGEAAHEDKAFKATFQAEVERLTDVFAKQLGDKPDSREVALGLVALAVGGIALSRAVADEAYSDRILRAARVIGHAAQRTPL